MLARNVHKGDGAPQGADAALVLVDRSVVPTSSHDNLQAHGRPRHPRLLFSSDAGATLLERPSILVDTFYNA